MACITEILCRSTDCEIYITNPDGSVIDYATLAEGDEIMITYVPRNGYIFDHWEDGNGNVITPERVVSDTSFIFLAVDGMTYVAIFDAIPYTITTIAQDGNGTVTPSFTANYGDVVMVIATPNSGYTFVAWQSDGETVSTDLTFQFTVTEDITLTALFTEDTYSVVTHSDDSARGIVTGGGTFLYGDTCTLTATPTDASSYYFVSWDDGDTTNPRSFVVTEDTERTASFGAYTYTLTVTSNGTAFGTVSGGGTYEYGTTVRLYAIPKPGYTFSRWVYVSNNTEVTYSLMDTTTVVISGNATYKAYFIGSQCSLRGATGGNGTGTILYGNTNIVTQSVSVPAGTTVTLTATPTTGNSFARWENGSTEPTRVFTAYVDTVVTAYFGNYIYVNN